MGKLTIEGKASRKIEADTEEITLSFQYHAENSAEASKKVISECELLLKELTHWGISPEQIYISDDDIDQRYDDRMLYVTAAREITIELPYNMEFNNSLMELIQKKQMNIDYDISYSLSNYKEIHKELIQEALADSKEKAELIAAAMGQRITGIDSLKISDQYDVSDWTSREQGSTFGVLADRAPMLSDKLKAPLNDETETVEVVWIMSV